MQREKQYPVDELSNTWASVAAKAITESKKLLEALMHERDEKVADRLRGQIMAYNEILQLAGEPRLEITVVV